MSEERAPWAAPGDSGAPMPPPQPRYGEYAPPGWTPLPPPPNQWGQGGPGWSPPPRPGLIPLRPLFLGDIMGAAFRVLRRNPKPTFGFALLVSLAIGVVTSAIVGLASWAALSRLPMTATTDLETISAGSGLLILLAAVLAGLVQLTLSAIPQGVIALEVARGALGERLTLAQLWRGARGRIGALIGWNLIVAFALSLLIFIAFVVVVLAGAVSGPAAAVGFGIPLGFGIVALAVWLGTKLEFVAPLIVIERCSIGTAMRRSWSLTRVGFWRIFGITLLINIVLSVAAQIVTTPISFIGGLLTSVANPNQSVDAALTASIALAIAALVAGVLINAVILVPQTAVPALLYLDARMRREGLDIQMQRHTEATAAGQTTPDPFA